MPRFLSGIGRSLNRIYKSVGGKLLVDELLTNEGVNLTHDMALTGGVEAWTGAGGTGAQSTTVSQSEVATLTLGLCQTKGGTLRFTASIARLTDFGVVVGDVAKWSSVMVVPALEDLGGGSTVYGPPMFAWSSATGGAGILYPTGTGIFASTALLINQLGGGEGSKLPQLFYGYQQPDAPGFGNSRWTALVCFAETNAFGAGTTGIALLHKTDLVSPGDARADGYGLVPPW